MAFSSHADTYDNIRIDTWRILLLFLLNSLQAIIRDVNVLLMLMKISENWLPNEEEVHRVPKVLLTENFTDEGRCGRDGPLLVSATLINIITYLRAIKKITSSAALTTKRRRQPERAGKSIAPGMENGQPQEKWARIWGLRNNLNFEVFILSINSTPLSRTVSRNPHPHPPITLRPVEQVLIFVLFCCQEISRYEETFLTESL